MTYSTKKATDHCNKTFALDTSRVPETVETLSTPVEVQCLLHDGFYEVPFRKLAAKSNIHSPGCPECKNQARQLKTKYCDPHGPDGRYDGQVASDFQLMVQVHRTYPDYFPGRPHGVGFPET